MVYALRSLFPESAADDADGIIRPLLWEGTSCMESSWIIIGGSSGVSVGDFRQDTWICVDDRVRQLMLIGGAGSYGDELMTYEAPAHAVPYWFEAKH